MTVEELMALVIEMYDNLTDGIDEHEITLTAKTRNGTYSLTISKDGGAENA